MKKWRLIIIGLVIAGILFISSFFSFFNGVKDFFWRTAQPVSLVFNVSFGKLPSFFDNLFHLKQLVAQNSDLVNENLSLQSQLVKLQEVRYENELLKKELNFAKTQDIANNLIPAAIIGKSTGYLKLVTVDKGTENGVENGQAVISQGFLVGTVSDARKKSADITLITDYNSLVPVVLQQSRGTGLLRGGIDGLTIENVPLNIQPDSTENVLTSGLGGQIPEGLAVGKFKKVISKPGDIFQKIAIVSPISFSKLEVIFIVENER